MILQYLLQGEIKTCILLSNFYCCAITGVISILHGAPSLLLDSLFSPGSQSEPQQAEAVHQSPDFTVSRERPNHIAGLHSTPRLSQLWLRLLAHTAAQPDAGTGERVFVMDSVVSPSCPDSSVCAEAEHALVNPVGFWQRFWHYWRDLLQQVTWRQAPGGGANTTSRGLTWQGVNSTFWQQEEKEEGSCLEQEGEMKSIYI